MTRLMIDTNIYSTKKSRTNARLFTIDTHCM